MKNERPDDIPPADDLQLTAYALDELAGEDRAAVEARLARDPEARATVAAIRALAGEMSAALAAESLTETSPRVEALRDAPLAAGSDVQKTPASRAASRGQLIRFPQFYYLISGVAAACFITFVVTRDPPAPKPKSKQYTELTLTSVALPTLSLEDAAGTEGGQTGGPLFADSVVATEGNLSLLGDKNSTSLLFPGRDREAGEVAPMSVARAEPIGKFAAQAVAFTPSLDRIAMVSRGMNPERSPAGAGWLRSPLPLTAFRFSAASGDALSSGSALPLWARRGPALAGGGNSPVGEVRMTPTLLAEITHHWRLQDDKYSYVPDNDFVAAARSPFSTFSLDVDTASYANVRRYLKNGMRPPAGAVRVEELVNYFPYRYAAPVAATGSGETSPPLAASLEVAAAPWADGHRLVRIGLKTREVTLASRAPANLVFLIDVSGSMDQPNKLSLVKESLRLLVTTLRADDRVAIVTYAGDSGLALPSTPALHTREIVTALENLRAGGSTNGEMGIHLAYDIATANFVKGGLNRVILCTDGDFNVGATNADELSRLVAEKAKTGVFLSTLGFGMGNLEDATLEKLADRGNGSYGYIDTRREAEKILVEQVNGTLATVAQDVKIQVDFNPGRVASYRLIGYENRLLKKEDFNDDRVEAGEIGAGHSVTALYEVVPVGGVTGKEVDESRYAPVAAQRPAGGAASGELLTVRVRYKEPAGDVSRRLEFPLTDAGTAFVDATPDFKFAAAVASFGMILRNSPHKGSATFDQVATWAAAGMVDDVGGWRSEFLDLTRIAKTL